MTTRSGTVNLITPAKQAQAQTLIKKGRTVSLARDIGPQPVLMYNVTFPGKRERVDVVLGPLRPRLSRLHHHPHRRPLPRGLGRRALQWAARSRTA